MKLHLPPNLKFEIQFDTVFDSSKTDATISMDNYDTWTMMKILEQYNGNLQMIEQEVRSLYKFRSGVSTRMEKFEQLQRMQNTTQRNKVQEVHNLLC